MLKKSIKIAKTALYYLSREPDRGYQAIWFVFHGYGQRAASFLREFEALSSQNILVVAPEALNRFYLDKGAGPVGASWMTREERDSEITDYIHFLNAVFSEVSHSLPAPAPELTVLGFSQGVAAAWRWTLAPECPARRIIIWGAELPPVSEWTSQAHSLENQDIILVHGQTDPWFTPLQAEKQFQLLNRHNLSCSRITYDSGHEINQNTLHVLSGAPFPHAPNLTEDSNLP